MFGYILRPITWTHFSTNPYMFFIWLRGEYKHICKYNVDSIRLTPIDMLPILSGRIEGYKIWVQEHTAHSCIAFHNQKRLSCCCISSCCIHKGLMCAYCSSILRFDNSNISIIRGGRKPWTADHMPSDNYLSGYEFLACFWNYGTINAEKRTVFEIGGPASMHSGERQSTYHSNNRVEATEIRLSWKLKEGKI